MNDYIRLKTLLVKNYLLYKRKKISENEFNIIKLNIEKRLRIIESDRLDEKEKIAYTKLVENNYLEDLIKELKKQGVIKEFDELLLSKMENIFVESDFLPKGNLREHFNNWTTRGNCFVMSDALSKVLGDASVLVRGYLHTPVNNFEHQWVEFDDKVYDTTFHAIFPRDLYYDLYDVKIENKNIKK